MARPKGVTELPRYIQGGLLRYLKIQEMEGRPMSTIWAEIFEIDLVQGMKLAIQVIPKELLVDIAADINVDTTQIDPSLLHEALRQLRDSRDADEIPEDLSLDSPGGPTGISLLQ